MFKFGLNNNRELVGMNFLTKFLVPVGIFLAFTPNIFEPTGLWRLAAVWYFYGVTLFAMVVIIICKKAPFEGGEGWAEDKQKFKIGICIVRIILTSRCNTLRHPNTNKMCNKHINLALNCG